MTRIITKDGIKLPFMGRDKFIELMRLGLGYDRQTRTFHIADFEHIDHVKATLTEILRDEVKIAQTCVLCRKFITCSECEYYHICGSPDIPAYCICQKCYSTPDLYERYVKKTTELTSA